MSAPPDLSVACLPPAAPRGRPRWPLPAGTIDSHFHIFEPGAPLAPARSYTPHVATLDDWRRFAGAVGIEKALFVQLSVYGLDNQVLLRALAAEPDRLRGIAVVDPRTPPDELRRLHDAGVRGVRINARNSAGLPFAAAEALANAVAPLGWIVEFLCLPAQFRELAGRIADLPVPVVIDHLGMIDLDDRAAEGDLWRLFEGGAHMKVSAPYRLTGDPLRFYALAAGFAAAWPDRLLWGTDWPHPDLWNDMPDDTAMIDRLAEALGDDQTRRKVFADNAEALFFAATKQGK